MPHSQISQYLLWISAAPIAIGDVVAYIAITTLYSNAVDKDNQGKVMGLCFIIISLTWALTALLGGVLASSRTESGRDDRGVTFLRLLQDLSVYQIRFHYIVYMTVKRLFDESALNVAVGSQARKCTVFIPAPDLIAALNLTPSPRAGGQPAHSKPRSTEADGMSATSVKAFEWWINSSKSGTWSTELHQRLPALIARSACDEG